MPLSEKMLMHGEKNVRTTRTHVKVLLLPFVILLAVAFATSYGAFTVDDAGNGYVRWTILGVAAVVLIVFVVVPFLRWYLWTYTLTTQRIVEQRGILTRTGRIIPLSRINDVSFEKNLNDRVLGCGTLIIHNASEEQGLQLKDIPSIEDFHRNVSDLVFKNQHQDDEKA